MRKIYYARYKRLTKNENHINRKKKRNKNTGKRQETRQEKMNPKNKLC